MDEVHNCVINAKKLVINELLLRFHQILIRKSAVSGALSVHSQGIISVDFSAKDHNIVAILEMNQHIWDFIILKIDRFVPCFPIFSRIKGEKSVGKLEFLNVRQQWRMLWHHFRGKDTYLVLSLIIPCILSVVIFSTRSLTWLLDNRFLPSFSYQYSVLSKKYPEVSTYYRHFIIKRNITTFILWSRTQRNLWW